MNMKKIILSLLLVVCLTVTLCAPALAASPWEEVGSAQELAAALAETPASAMRVRSAAPAAPVRVLLLADALPDDCGARRVLHYADYDEFILEFDDLSSAQAAYDTLTGDYALSSCWLDTEDNGAETFAASSWGQSYMGLDAYKSDTHAASHFDAKRVTVAVIDSGADMTISALQARAEKCYDFVSGNDTGHGTQVASLLDALLPAGARLMLLRVFDDDGQARRTPVRTALQYAIENGADVINLSLGWEGANASYTFLDDVLQRAYSSGISVVCAAGNSHAYVDTCYPANHSTTIAVSSVNQKLEYEVYSNYGDKIDFAAPGSGITTVTVGGGTKRVAGTSFAAPHITAACAQLKLADPTLAASGVYARLCAYAKDLGVTGKDNLYGWGIPILPASIAENYTHAWDAGRTTTLATRTTAGQRVYTCTICGETRTETIPATQGGTGTGFADVPAAQYYAAPVAWAVANGITNGTSPTTFSPDEACTRAQVVTFLWRAMGSPEPTAASPFTDVQDSGQYYYKAVLWAVEKGVTNGTSATTFSPGDTVTRAQVVTFLWRLRGSSAAAAGNPFADVDAGSYYYKAVLWAAANGVTDGVSPTMFAPDAPCTRAQIVTFLYRNMA